MKISKQPIPIEVSKLVAKKYTILTKRNIMSLKTILCENATANDQEKKSPLSL